MVVIRSLVLLGESLIGFGCVDVRGRVLGV